MEVWSNLDRIYISGDDNEDDVESFCWREWLAANKWQQNDEEMIKRVIDSALPTVVTGLDGDRTPILMESVLETLSEKHEKTKYEMFVWMNSGPNVPFDLFNELDVGIQLVKANVTSEAQMASRIAQKVSLPTESKCTTELL